MKPSYCFKPLNIASRLCFFIAVFVTAAMLLTNFAHAQSSGYVGQPWNRGGASSHNLTTTSGNSDYGVRERHPVTGQPSFHSGIDLYKGMGGSTFSASNSGTVSTGYINGYGNTITITSGNYQTFYAHVADGGTLVNNGGTVSAGQNLGIVGSTGRSSGPHLHFETRVKNPNDPNDWVAVDPEIFDALVASGMDPNDPAFAQMVIDQTEAKHGRARNNAPSTGVGNGTAASAARQLCDGWVRDSLSTLKDAKMNMENQAGQELLQKPPSVGQLGCVDQISAQFADKVGSIFTDPISGLRSAKYPDFVEQTFLSYMADNFLGSTFSAISESITTVVNDTVSQVTGSIFGGLGGAFGGNAQFECQVMETLWAMFQCIDFPQLPSLGDLDLGGSFLSRPDSCVGQALYDGAIDMLNNSGMAKRMMDWSDTASQNLGSNIRQGITGRSQ